MKKTDFERAQELAQECIMNAPVIILGSGASAAHGIPGMTALASHLQGTTSPSKTPEEHMRWTEFVNALNTSDLETALTKTQLSESQTGHIVSETRSFLQPYDHQVLLTLLEDRKALPLTRLYRHLFSSTHKTIDVVTPNYDRLAEYAADAGEFAHYTGMTFGHIGVRSRDPQARVHQNGQAVRTVCVWKVHGSLDWFHNEAGQVVCVPACANTPSGQTPIMITPGNEKYRLAYNEPTRTIVSCSDAALEKARSYLCVGFGFNDVHVQSKLVDNCATSKTIVVVLAMELTPKAKSFLFSGKCQKFLALERSPTGTRMYTRDDLAGVDLPGCDAWKLDDFLDMTIGAAA